MLFTPDGSVANVGVTTRFARAGRGPCLANRVVTPTFGDVIIVAVLDPVSGTLAHNCDSMFVVVNSALLLYREGKCSSLASAGNRDLGKCAEEPSRPCHGAASVRAAKAVFYVVGPIKSGRSIS